MAKTLTSVSQAVMKVGLSSEGSEGGIVVVMRLYIWEQVVSSGVHSPPGSG